MPQVEIVLALLVVVVALVTLARRIAVPYPVLLVIGGLVLGLIPGLPRVELQPNLVFALFLPPLIYWEALNFSYRELRRNLRSITLLAVVLVLVTTCVVAVVAHAAVGLPWATAFVLGAIVSPTDAVAAAAVFERLGAPRRLLAVIEGESLINDATALIAYRAAVAAVVSGHFSLFSAGLDFVKAAVGGVAIGLLVGWLIAQLRRRFADASVGTTISLLSGFAAYLPADSLGCSGVLAVVATGLYLGRLGPRVVSSGTRLQTQEVWQTVVFLLNGLIFILIGLQLHRVFDALAGYSPLTLAWYAVLVGVTLIAVRMVWMFPGTYIARGIGRRPSEPYPRVGEIVVAGWAGMSGVVSLATALALPAAIDGGGPFPARDLVVFLAFMVILITLVFKGLTLPMVIRWMGVQDDGAAEIEETKARLKAARAGLRYLQSLDGTTGVPVEKLEHLRSHYEARIRRLAARCGDDPEADGLEATATAYEQLQRAALTAERQEAVRLRDINVIGDEVLRRVQRDLDLEELQLGS